MRIWLALIVAPLLALADQTVAFSMVEWACSHQSVTLLHASHAIFLALAAVATAAAYLNWQGTRGAAVSQGEGAAQIHFLCGIAAAVAVLSTTAIAALWIPTWMISPCIA